MHHPLHHGLARAGLLGLAIAAVACSSPTPTGTSPRVKASPKPPSAAPSVSSSKAPSQAPGSAAPSTPPPTAKPSLVPSSLPSFVPSPSPTPEPSPRSVPSPSDEGPAPTPGPTLTPAQFSALATQVSSANFNEGPFQALKATANWVVASPGPSYVTLHGDDFGPSGTSLIGKRELNLILYGEPTSGREYTSVAALGDAAANGKARCTLTSYHTGSAGADHVGRNWTALGGKVKVTSLTGRLARLDLNLTDFAAAGFSGGGVAPVGTFDLTASATLPILGLGPDPVASEPFTRDAEGQFADWSASGASDPGIVTAKVSPARFTATWSGRVNLNLGQLNGSSVVRQYTLYFNGQPEAGKSYPIRYRTGTPEANPNLAQLFYNQPHPSQAGVNQRYVGYQGWFQVHDRRGERIRFSLSQVRLSGLDVNSPGDFRLAGEGEAVVKGLPTP